MTEGVRHTFDEILVHVSRDGILTPYPSTVKRWSNILTLIGVKWKIRKDTYKVRNLIYGLKFFSR